MRWLLGILILILLVPTFACAGERAITFLGFRIEPTELDYYNAEVTRLGNAWSGVVEDWEEVANTSTSWPLLAGTARDCSSQMERIIDSWDDVSVPHGLGECHTLIRQAMSYERGAFDLMAYHFEWDDPWDDQRHNEVYDELVELWNSKDEALWKAIDCYNERS